MYGDQAFFDRMIMALKKCHDPLFRINDLDDYRKSLGECPDFKGVYLRMCPNTGNTLNTVAPLSPSALDLCTRYCQSGFSS